MKKQISFILLIIILSISASASWTNFQNDEGGSGVNPASASIPLDQNLITINFTCGTGFRVNVQPRFLDITGDGIDEMILSCSSDAEGSPRISIIDNLYGAISTKGLSGNGLFGISNDYYFWFDLTDINNDGDYEIVVLNVNDTSGVNQEAELLVFSYNNTLNDIVFLYNFTVINGTNNVTGFPAYKPNDKAVNDANRIIECFNSTYCMIWHEEDVIMVNLTISDASVLWVHNLTEAGLTDMDLGFDPQLEKFLQPIIVDSTHTGIMDVNFLSVNEQFVSYYGFNGSIRLNKTLDVWGATDLSTWSFVDCDASRCNTDRMNMIIGGSNIDDGVCQFYDTQDGSLEQTNVIDSGNTEGTWCWVENRDEFRGLIDDDNDELCGVTFDSGSTAGNSMVCEELTLFQQTTFEIEDGLSWGVAGTHTSGFNSQMSIADVDGDGLYDIIMDSGIWSIPEDESTTVSNIFLNDSATGTEIMTLIVEFSETDIFEIMSINLATDTYYVTGSGEGFGFISNELIDFTGNGAYPSVQSPMCNNATVTWTCGYDTACVFDAEGDRFKMEVDCYSDGTEIHTDQRFNTVQGLRFLDGCNLSSVDNEGVYNATFTVWDNQHTQNQNNTIIIEYYISNSSNCFDDTNTGDIDLPFNNTIPQFIGLPSSDIPSPYCLNSTIVFDCEDGICYEDIENDKVYFKLDCDGDGDYESINSADNGAFSCRFETSGVQQVNIQVCDVMHTSCNSVSFSVNVDTRTPEDVIADGVLDCGSEVLFDIDDNGTVVSKLPPEIFRPLFLSNALPDENIGSQDFCLGSTVGFMCDEGVCYSIEDGNIMTVLDVDCENDGIIDYMSFGVINHTFKCTFDEFNSGNATHNNITNSFIYTINLTITNDIGQADTMHQNITIGNNTQRCAFGSDVGEGCDTGGDCNTGKCKAGFCVSLLGNEPCSYNRQCLSKVCSNGKCTKADTWTRIDTAKGEELGDSPNTNNFLALTIIILVGGLLIGGSLTAGGGIWGVAIGGIAMIGLAIFFTLVGWLSPFILLGMFIVLLVMVVFAFMISGG